MWASARRTEALLDIALDISEPDQRFLVHPRDLLGAGLRRPVGVTQCPRIFGAVRRRLERVADDDLADEIGIGLDGPGPGRIAFRNRPSQAHLAALDVPLLAKSLAALQRPVFTVDVMGRGQPFGPRIRIADVVVDRRRWRIDHDVMASLKRHAHRLPPRSRDQPDRFMPPSKTVIPAAGSRSTSVASVNRAIVM